MAIDDERQTRRLSGKEFCWMLSKWEGRLWQLWELVVEKVRPTCLSGREVVSESRLPPSCLGVRPATFDVTTNLSKIKPPQTSTFITPSSPSSPTCTIRHHTRMLARCHIRFILLLNTTDNRCYKLHPSYEHTLASSSSRPSDIIGNNGGRCHGLVRRLCSTLTMGEYSWKKTLHAM